MKTNALVSVLVSTVTCAAALGVIACDRDSPDTQSGQTSTTSVSYGAVHDAAVNSTNTVTTKDQSTGMYNIGSSTGVNGTVDAGALAPTR